MSMTRQRWIFVGLLALGLGALAMDRLVLSPAGAAAAVPDGPAAGAGEPEAPAAPAGPVRRTLADRLRTVQWTPPSRDGFRADEAWVQPPKPEPVAGASDPGAFSIAEWEGRNPLRSIFALVRQEQDPAGPPTDTPREYKARLGDRDVTVGDTVAGCRVVQIEATELWVEHDGRCYLIDMLHPRRADGRDRKPSGVLVKSSAEAAAPETPPQ
jgi:hypothetical protein